MKANNTNNTIMNVINQAAANAYNTKFTRFNYCQAYIGEKQQLTIDNVTYNYRLVKSYYTITGFVDLDNGIFYELGKYSQTTSKQMTQIYNQVFRGICDNRVLVNRVA